MRCSRAVELYDIVRCPTSTKASRGGKQMHNMLHIIEYPSQLSTTRQPIHCQPQRCRAEKEGGLGILDIKTEGGISQIKEFRHALYGDSEPGKLMMYSLKYSQMESGLGFHLLEDPKVLSRGLLRPGSCRCARFSSTTTLPSL